MAKAKPREKSPQRFTPKRCNEKNMRKWIEALEGGEIKQARGVLAKSDGKGGFEGMCCLGVACEIRRRATGDGKWEGLAPGEDYKGADKPFVIDSGDHTGELPPEVAEWLGLYETAEDSHGLLFDTMAPTLNPVLGVAKVKDVINGDTEPTIHAITATAANDTFKWDFKRIAKALRKTYLGEQ